MISAECEGGKPNMITGVGSTGFVGEEGEPNNEGGGSCTATGATW
jgi:hypothetical protein